MDIFEEGRELYRFPSPNSDPWIFYSHGKRNREHTFYSLSERRVHNKRIKEIINNEILCSLHGWLILSNENDRRSCQLFNPVSMATIQLPVFSDPCCYDFGALSCDPNNPNCIVMMIKVERGLEKCYFCRPGDVDWNKKDLEFEEREICSNYYPDGINAVGCYKDQICIFTLSQKIFILVANPPHLTLTDLGVKLSHFDPGNFVSFYDFLVEYDDKLFLIRRFDLRRDAYHFVVFKLNVGGEKKELVVVENLGGQAFFLSPFTPGVACSAENYGIKANTIYFTRPCDPCIYSFDLQKKVLTFSLPCPNVKKNLVQAKWILPQSPNPPCKLGRKVDIISPPQMKKSTMLQPSISRSIRKDRFRLPDDITEKLSSRFDVSDWSKLPHDVLISVAEKISCVSYARISITCKSWGSVITWAPKKLLCCPTFLHMPSSSIEIFNFRNKSRYSVPVLENPKVLNIQYAKYGWLLMTRYGGLEIFFLNPITAEKIEIPTLPVIQIRSFCFTSLPTSSNCSVIAICEGQHSCVYHIRRGVMKWTKIEIPEFNPLVGSFELTPYSNPVFHKGVFYWILGCGNLCTCDPTKVEMKFLVEPRSPRKSVSINYLFESGDKLMSVWVGRHGKWVRVYKLNNEASMAWKEVNTLDNKVVFLGRSSSLVTKTQGLEDMVCFNRFFDDNQPLMYSLKTGELRVYGGGYYSVSNFCDIPEYQIKSAWIKPNVKQHFVRELSWCDVVFNISQLFVTD